LTTRLFRARKQVAERLAAEAPAQARDGKTKTPAASLSVRISHE